VVKELRDSGQEVVAVDSHDDTPYAAVVRARVAFVAGDGREPETLSRANLPGARSIVVTTEDDAVNLSVGLLSKQMAPKVRTVLRIFDAGFASAIQDVLDIDAALSASRLAAPEFVAAAMFPDTIAAFVMRGHLVALTRGGEGGRVIEVGGARLHVHGLPLTNPEIFDKA
jgi:Trk K+ transport system NAD-binding subunit